MTEIQLYDPWGGSHADDAAVRGLRAALVNLMHCHPQTWPTVLTAVAIDLGVDAGSLSALGASAQEGASHLGSTSPAQPPVKEGQEAHQEAVSQAVLLHLHRLIAVAPEAWGEVLARLASTAAQGQVHALNLLADAAVQMAAEAHQKACRREGLT